VFDLEILAGCNNLGETMLIVGDRVTGFGVELEPAPGVVGVVPGVVGVVPGVVGVVLPCPPAIGIKEGGGNTSAEVKIPRFSTLNALKL